MDRIIILFLLSCSPFLCHGQRNLTSNSSPYVEAMKDPVTGAIWKSACMNVSSNRRSGFRDFRKSATVEFLASMSKSNQWTLEMRLTMNTNINDWPIDQKAYLGINGYAVEIKLNDVQSKIYHIKDKNETTDTAGIVITDISTRDFQLFRKQADITTAFGDVRALRSLQLILYFGGKPAILDFDSFDIQKVQAIIK